MSQLVTITQAVVDQLNGDDFDTDHEFTAERVYIPQYDTATTTAMKVLVLGLAETATVESRNDYQHDYTVAIGIYKRVDDVEDMDDVSEFREDVLTFFKDHDRAGDAALVAIQNEPVYDPEQLERFSTFVSVIELTYRLIQ